MSRLCDLSVDTTSVSGLPPLEIFLPKHYNLLAEYLWPQQKIPGRGCFFFTSWHACVTTWKWNYACAYFSIGQNFHDWYRCTKLCANKPIMKCWYIISATLNTWYLCKHKNSGIVSCLEGGVLCVCGLRCQLSDGENLQAIFSIGPWPKKYHYHFFVNVDGVNRFVWWQAGTILFGNSSTIESWYFLVVKFSGLKCGCENNRVPFCGLTWGLNDSSYADLSIASSVICWACMCCHFTIVCISMQGFI